ncbi:MAG: polysaccharide pyruvyl transferase family protein, partial [Clostridiales bacterium]|nr:polysaccharide pyruvyl transferase family protein [Clostridiales bacterium]
MKIGILTFHRSRNYGAVLQCYGLATFLTELGHQVEVIDYCCVTIEDGLKLWNHNACIIKSILQFGFRYVKKIKFDYFISKKLPISNYKNLNAEQVKDIVKQYDCLITGSDQVWCEAITGGDSVYFLDFPDYKGNRIAYAASAGDNIALSKKAVKFIQNIGKVSVREEKLQSILRSERIEASLCCDPTLLLGAESYISFMRKRIIKGKYVFVFMIWESEKLLECGKKYAKENNLTLVTNKNNFLFLRHSAPEDFLSWIYYSECIFTNSFHGTAFSILFHKKFYSDTVKKDGTENRRIVDLLEKTGCRKCALSHSYNFL